jgi:hypothetical protein
MSFQRSNSGSLAIPNDLEQCLASGALKEVIFRELGYAVFALCKDMQNKVCGCVGCGDLLLLLSPTPRCFAPSFLTLPQFNGSFRVKLRVAASSQELEHRVKTVMHKHPNMLVTARGWCKQQK